MCKMIKLTLLGCIVFLSGCVPSLRGIANEKNTIYDEGLIGLWVNDDGDDTWEFVKKDKNLYGLEVTDGEGKKGRFLVGLVKIKEQKFLDLFPDEMEWSANGFYRVHFIPAHTFILAELKNDKLVLSMMAPDATEEFLKENRKTAKHEMLNDRLIFTGSQKQLRKFLHAQSGNDKIFPDPQTYTKKKKPAKSGSKNCRDKQTGK